MFKIGLTVFLITFIVFKYFSTKIYAKLTNIIRKETNLSLYVIPSLVKYNHENVPVPVPKSCPGATDETAGGP